MLKYYHTKQDHSVILIRLEMKLAWKKPGILSIGEATWFKHQMSVWVKPHSSELIQPVNFCSAVIRPGSQLRIHAILMSLFCCHGLSLRGGGSFIISYLCKYNIGEDEMSLACPGTSMEPNIKKKFSWGEEQKGNYNSQRRKKTGALRCTPPQKQREAALRLCHLSRDANWACFSCIF